MYNDKSIEKTKLVGKSLYSLIYLLHKIFTKYKGNNSNFTLEKPERHHFNHMSKVTLPVIGHIDSYTSCYTEKGAKSHLWYSCQEWIKPSLSWENIRQIWTQKYATKYLINIFQKCHGQETKNNLGIII